MNFTSVITNDIASFLKSQLSLANNDIELAYENEIKPTPLKRPIISVGMERITVSDHLTVTASDGSISETNKRNAQVKVKISLFAPYSTGSTGCYAIMDKIISVLMFSYSDHKILEAESGNVNYIRDAGALVLDTYFTASEDFSA